MAGCSTTLYIAYFFPCQLECQTTLGKAFDIHFVRLYYGVVLIRMHIKLRFVCNPHTVHIQ